ncbi:MAG TPA: M64 family metallopeptidase [Thermoanaerobaculia bacterium]|nr:M64 family metallopeptidase [Thermoanaerobaculia bacterium]
MFEVDEQGFVELYSSHRVGLEAPPVSPQDAAAGPAGDPDAFRVQLSDAGGAVVFEELVHLPAVVRGEFHGAGSAVDGFEIERFSPIAGRRAFVARVPALTAGTLVIEGVRTSSFALADLAPERSLRLPTAAVTRLGSGAASAANRVDLLIVGDGYRQQEQSVFLDDATGLAAGFFAISPYREYRNFVTVRTLFVASAQSGADHPPYQASCASSDPTCCGDSAAQGDPLAGTFVDTAFDGRFCAFNIARLAVVDQAKVLTAAAAAPAWDRILVVLNDDTYGGSGGFVSVVSTNPSAVDIARHEYGHSFTGLADEYDAATPGYPPCSDRHGPPCEANVTDETARALIKWEPWIAPATPVPTPEGNPQYAGAVGLFEGARYLATGMYRPRDRCLMNVLGVPFGEVCREAYVRKLYEGGWGVPAKGIDPIEPGSETPSPGKPVKTAGTPVTFEVDLLKPAGGPGLEVTWRLDGQVVASGTPRLELPPPPAGLHEVELEVADRTPFVLAGNAGALRSTRRWSLESTAAPRPRDCVADATTLCLEGGRFEVKVEWKDFAGSPGQGAVVPVGSDDSGLFSFLEPDNWEMLVKVLDACDLNQRYWVFLAATTNLEYAAAVTDTDTGATRTYLNQAGDRAPAVTDTDAFDGCPGAGASAPSSSVLRLDRLDRHPQIVTGSTSGAAAACVAGPESLCLNQGRFRVEVSWRDFEDRTGIARVVPVGSPDSGLFYIFDPNNWEMLVKVLDACGVNQRYWVFAAATTNVEYTLEVTDTATGETRSYDNALGISAPAITDTDAFATCP